MDIEPPKEHICALWRELPHAETLSVRNELYEFYYPWCRRIAAKLYLKYRHPLIDWFDLVHTCSLALLDSIDKFDSARGVPFEPYAYKRLRGSVLDTLTIFTKDYTKKNTDLKTLCHLERIESPDLNADSFETVINAAIDLAFGEFLELGIISFDGQQDTIQTAYESNAQSDLIVTLVDSLEKNERFIIKSHYFQHLNFSEIATILNLSKPRISQIHKAAMYNLRSSYERLTF